MQTANRLNDLFNKVVNETFFEFADKNLQPNDLAMTLIDLTDLEQQNENAGKATKNKADFKMVDYRGSEPIYPASIIKLFYLVATHQWLEDGKIVETEELKRAYKDMIVDSSNDATNYVIDVITDTTSGPELSEEEMIVWTKKRNIVNDYFKKQGYENINVNQKVWGDGSYGRERIFVGKQFELRNKLTTNATAKLLADIATQQSINSERSKAMLELMARDFSKASDDIDNQATGFMGSCLPKNAKLWSKAGWMSTARHDAAYIELADGIRFVLVVFISHHAKEYWMLPTIAAKIIRALEGTYASGF
jgi:beta-lactamase class A